ncbi:uncharacterized protein LOC106876578 [Octopus bimaculoides]|uniref:Uncharacterized protein n=1 Tax=Octopus bimaculoides TaxID=37653 RepID=A0A0L8GIM2_OCTBM|nr:uncharacterized protein LOC106876578 [Octopus bimaculoides]XP_052828712.1 uncharacterized protein LOC106876578 [Octopus bimaculoides]XP_052828713.1 uncharacterized protein LOC106876578 [Octopus bimaculoides]|eukprot:XP_014780668.1 PREDICTED: uncharacterized protein LOC106876577 [Octopus bimaculoides]
MNIFESMISVRYLIASVLCATCCSMPHLVDLITGAEHKHHGSTTQSSNNNSGASSNNEQSHKSFSSPSTSQETHRQSKQYSETIYHHYAKIGQSLDRQPQQLKIGALTDTLSNNQQIDNRTMTNINLSSMPFSSSSNMSVNKTIVNVLGSISVNNSSNVTQVEEDLPVASMSPPEDIAVHKDLPLPLLIASPVAAVSIIIFVCIAYYCHSSQLDARARQLALKYAVISTEPPVCSRGVPSTSSVDMDLIRKPSLRPSTSRTSTPNQTPDGSKRGSINWVAIGDQEVITYTAARRHSTFIL